jgi:ribosomal 50S subunit-associated protein YjgA (DUF615 family)
VRQLAQDARRERAAGQPPRHYRALFRLLDETLKTAGHGGRSGQD